MTVREFAERVLFSNSLEEKLEAAPADLRDEARGAAVSADLPGRPPELRWRAAGRAEMPREPALHADSARGRLLHFFANHELLAMELMALALLKFPQAPAAFRQGLVHTLAEEQVHTRWYLEAMRGYGVSFGDHPVNGFFWKAVAGMESPLDYVARLPLTFEQANLDYSRHYRGVFQRLGDAATAELFARIHEDEIGHVGYGLRWFRKWKEPPEDEFAALERRLHFPLSAARAKGPDPIDRQGRLRAGLTERFVRQLDLFSRSRGRTPRVHVFSPEAERVLAEAGRDRPSDALTADLDLLPVVLARREDLVLLQREPDPAHLEKLRGAGLELPELEVLQRQPSTGEWEIAPDSLTRRRKLGGLRPWAWSPPVSRLLAPLAPQLPAGRVTRWEESWAELYHKGFGASLLEEIGGDWPGVVARGRAEVEAAAEALFSAGWQEVLLKPLLGAAGRRHRRLDRGQLREAAPWLEGEEVLVEPWFERVLDFSLLGERLPGGGIVIKGFTRLEVTPEGRYLGSRASRRFGRLLPPEVARFFNGGEGGRSWLRDFYAGTVVPPLERRLQDARYEGPFGIDAFVHRHRGGLALRPVVEVNPRFTMGRVALELLRHAAADTQVFFRLLTVRHAREWERSGGGPLPDPRAPLAAWGRRLEGDDPPVLTGDPPRMRGGTLILNDARVARRFLAAATFLPPGAGGALDDAAGRR